MATFTVHKIGSSAAVVVKSSHGGGSLKVQLPIYSVSGQLAGGPTAHESAKRLARALNKVMKSRNW
jgi:hypothetical protein